jgi:hypothetical protein
METYKAEIETEKTRIADEFEVLEKRMDKYEREYGLLPEEIEEQTGVRPMSLNEQLAMEKSKREEMESALKQLTQVSKPQLFKIRPGMKS